MLKNFFQLNEASATRVVESQSELVPIIQENSLIENLVYRAPDFRAPRPRTLMREKVFRNVSFKSTLFYDVEFRKCTFEDCLFVGSEFQRCEFHGCSFSGSNLHKARFVDTYIDPNALVGVFNPLKHANIGVWVFQQLRANALNTHQPEFFQTADRQFRRWRRHELLSEFKREEKRLSEVWFPALRNWCYEFFIGYGHSLRRFAVTSLGLFLVMLVFNCWFWKSGSSGLSNSQKLDAVHGVFRTIYYTIITVTTVGYGDITPVTAGGMMVASMEALLGILWVGMLTSIIVKKVFR